VLLKHELKLPVTGIPVCVNCQNEVNRVHLHVLAFTCNFVTGQIIRKTIHCDTLTANYISFGWWSGLHKNQCDNNEQIKYCASHKDSLIVHAILARPNVTDFFSLFFPPFQRLHRRNWHPSIRCHKKIFDRLVEIRICVCKPLRYIYHHACAS
jgi:hypothetical protein